MRSPVNAPLLAHQWVRPSAGSPERVLLMLHGVFGMGTNFRTIAGRLCEQNPGWAVVLADLRGHGQSQGFAPPHTLPAAADDVLRLAASLELPVRAIAGHSFGGKVVLAALEQQPGWVRTAVVLDSDPGVAQMDVASSLVLRVLEALEALPRVLPSREFFQAELAAREFPQAIVAWLAMNVRRDGDAYSLRLDLPAIRSMLEDYRTRDYFPMLEASHKVALHYLIAGNGSALGPASQQRVNVLGQQGLLTVHHLANAGHWLHVDAPERVLEILTAALRATL
jgi:esterase